MVNLHLQAKLEPVDEESNDDLVHGDGFGKANGFSYSPFDPRLQGEMFPF